MASRSKLSAGLPSTPKTIALSLVPLVGYGVAIAASQQQPLGSTTQLVMVGLAAIIAIMASTRAPLLGFVLTTVAALQAYSALTAKGKAVKKFVPSEANKRSQLATYDHNKSPTLEEEQVKTMIPFSSNTPSAQSYQPVLGNQYLAATLN
jgi:hypothetical protein